MELGNLAAILVSCAFIFLSWMVVPRWLESKKISQYPGPRLARYTTWYRAYYDVVKSGGLLRHLQSLHLKYGPVVRIGPRELHFQSPEAFCDIYSYGNLSKEPTLYNSFPFHEASISYTDREDASRRRELLGPLFSRAATLKLEWTIQEKIEMLIAQLLKYGDTPVDLHMAIRSATIDIIAQYCFASSFDALEAPNFRNPILVGLQTGVESSWILKYLPWMLTVLENAPDWAVDLLPRENQFFRDLRIYSETQIDKYYKNPEQLDVASQATIFHHLLNSKRNPPSRKSLMGETMALLAAGHDTVGGAFTVGSFHIMKKERIRRKLLLELRDVWPDVNIHANFQALEKLPYLTAVIKESLRLSHGVVSNLPRVTGEDMIIAGYEVPENTIVSMSSVFMHWNKELFSDPLEFLPERWLGKDASELNKYLASYIN